MNQVERILCGRSQARCIQEQVGGNGQINRSDADVSHGAN
jgi:hypothetical protein